MRSPFPILLLGGRDDETAGGSFIINQWRASKKTRKKERRK